MDIALAGNNCFNTGWLTCYMGLPRTMPYLKILKDCDQKAFLDGWDMCNETPIKSRGHAYHRMCELKQARAFWIEDNGDEVEEKE